uniref:Transmembrane protein 53 n=1 Tax=Parascaris univalens TaxID=6257 RepID=A0A915BR08_PARUN
MAIDEKFDERNRSKFDRCLLTATGEKTNGFRKRCLQMRGDKTSNKK